MRVSMRPWRQADCAGPQRDRLEGNRSDEPGRSHHCHCQVRPSKTARIDGRSDQPQDRRPRIRLALPHPGARRARHDAAANCELGLVADTLVLHFCRSGPFALKVRWGSKRRTRSLVVLNVPDERLGLCRTPVGPAAAALAPKRFDRRQGSPFAHAVPTSNSIRAVVVRQNFSCDEKRSVSR